MNRTATTTHQGSVLFTAIIAIAILFVLAASGYYWRELTRDKNVVSAYLSFPFSSVSQPFVPPTKVREFRLIRNSHKAMLESPMIVDAALTQQDIAQLDIVRNQENPGEWLAEALEISFPGNAEIVKISLPCQGADPNECVKLVNAVTKAYQEKVILAHRIHLATARESYRKTIDECGSTLSRQLTLALERQEAATTPAEKAHAELLMDDCKAAREARSQLLLIERQLAITDGISTHMERTTGHTDEQVQIIQPAMIDLD